MGKYWDKQQDDLVIEINNSSGSTQERAISKLLPPLQTMAEAILNRYFRGSFNPWEYEIITSEAIQRVIEKLHQFNPDRSKSFSFCQTIIRNLYVTTLVRPSEKEQRWKQCVNEDPKIIDPEYKVDYGYVDHNIEREVINPNELILDRLYSLKKDVDASFKIMNMRQYERIKIGNPKPKYGFKTNALKNMVDTMINIFEQQPEIEYERFLIDLHIRTGIAPLTMTTFFGYLGMEFPHVRKIVETYTGYRDHRYPQTKEGVLQNLEKDITPKEKETKRGYGKRYYVKKER